MSGDAVSLAAEMTPYVSAAAAAYGAAVLARARDEAADATVGLGRRLLQRVFGVRAEGEQLPGPVADLAARPRDEDTLAAVRQAVFEAIASDPALEAQLRIALASAPQTVTHVRPGRDAISAAGNQTITVHNYAEGAARLPDSGSRRTQAWGNVPGRNPGFRGRKDLLDAVREALLSGDRAVVQALQGMGGVGKTQLAAEYAHRYADSYDLVWWIACEQLELIGEQFAALAQALGCAWPGAELAAMRRAVLSRLHGMERWLLIFDNAESPEHVSGWLPGGTGHIIITSRASGWAETAVPVEVGTLARAESAAILRDRLPAIAELDADRIADAVGDLALAVVQAAGYIAESGMPAREYTDLLEAQTAKVMQAGRPVSYPQSLAAVTQLALDRLRANDPAAADVVVLCAFLAPEPVPTGWFVRAAPALPARLARKAADPLAWWQLLTSARRSALVRIEDNELQMHRLTRAIIRSQLYTKQAAAARARVEAMITRSHVHISHRAAQDPGTWPEWAKLLPHLLALVPGRSPNPQLRQLAHDAAWYLGQRGDPQASHDLALQLHRNWHELLGPDDLATLEAQYVLAFALSELGRFEEARVLDEDTFTRRRRILGDNHIKTLNSANALAGRLGLLGDNKAAHDLLADTLSRARQELGQDHPDTIGFARNLAIYMSELGEPDRARQLHEDALARYRKVLGDDHPETIGCICNLAWDLRELGDLEAARQLYEDALTRYRQVLGSEHPVTLGCAEDLALILRAAGDYKTSRELDREALTGFRRVFGDDHPWTAEAIRRLTDD